jgi:hypothetical protein
MANQIEGVKSGRDVWAGKEGTGISLKYLKHCSAGWSGTSCFHYPCSRQAHAIHPMGFCTQVLTMD